MCIAIPSRVLSIDAEIALVERFGERLEVSLALMEDAVAPGDYLIVQARRFAVEKIDAETAEEIQGLLRAAFDGA